MIRVRLIKGSKPQKFKVVHNDKTKKDEILLKQMKEAKMII